MHRPETKAKLLLEIWRRIPPDNHILDVLLFKSYIRLWVFNQSVWVISLDIELAMKSVCYSNLSIYYYVSSSFSWIENMLTSPFLMNMMSADTMDIYCHWLVICVLRRDYFMILFSVLNFLISLNEMWCKTSVKEVV